MDDLPEGNLLLGGLPVETFRRIADDLRPVELPHGRVVVPPGGTLDRFYFITNGLISLLYETGDGESAEIAIVGREGGVGLSLIMGGRPFPAQAVVQMPGTAWTLAGSVLRREFEHSPEVRRAFLLYTQALMTQMAQTVVCNRHHSVELQLCRWILLSLDRLATNELQMTQEMIAHMLGVRRAGVTEAIARLQQAELVEHRRGRITVSDRAALEARSCECYAVIKEAYQALERDLGDEESAAHRA